MRLGRVEDNRTRLHPTRTAGGSFLLYESETENDRGTIIETEESWNDVL